MEILRSDAAPIVSDVARATASTSGTEIVLLMINSHLIHSLEPKTSETAKKKSRETRKETLMNFVLMPLTKQDNPAMRVCGIGCLNKDSSGHLLYAVTSTDSVRRYACSILFSLSDQQAHGKQAFRSVGGMGRLSRCKWKFQASLRKG